MTTAVSLAQSVAPGVSLGFKNRIINGGMTIDQRNDGASVAVDNNNDLYTLDRFACGDATDGSFTAQQVSTAPAGFSKSLKLTVASTDSSLAAGQFARVYQYIEGSNIADFGWGAAGASTITLSFWVQSSVTGTFSGSLSNSAFDRSYPFTYTINSANTWEQKTVTIAGDTSGTWLTTTGIGIRVFFSLGCGSTYSGTAGSWAGATYIAATGQTNWMANAGATFYITGVQLEKGTAATNFEFRDYGRELMMCQRYYETLISTTGGLGLMLFSYSPAGNYWGFWDMKVEKRATATVALTSSGYWVNSTPTIYPGITTAGFQSSGPQPYLNGTAGSPALYASAEL